jgi:DDE superfamily endonuclease
MRSRHDTNQAYWSAAIATGGCSEVGRNFGRSSRPRRINTTSVSVNRWSAWTRSRSRLHADVRRASSAKPEQEARRDNEYERCGTANVFCAVEPRAGRHFTFPTPDRSGLEFAQVAVSLASAYPTAITIHLVMDNLNIHSQKSLAMCSGPRWRAKSGSASPSITPLHTAVGSIKRKSKSGSSLGNVWESDAFLTLKLFAEAKA